MSEKAVVKTNTLSLPEKAGEYFRLICMTGRCKGEVYYLNAPRIVMGRNEKAEIPVHDIKSSREHCELVKIQGSYVLTDLKSQNGVIVNDLKVAQHKLKDSDKIIIGQTVFKFNILNILPPTIVEDVEDDGEDEEDIDEDDEIKKKAPNNKRKLILVTAVLLLALLMFDSSDKDEKEGPRDAKSNADRVVLDADSRRALTSHSYEDDELRIQVEAHIHRGLREFREKNYYRAIREFNLALVLSPHNASASYYLSKTKQYLDFEIESHFERAQDELRALRYHRAFNTYCAIMTLLQRDQNDQRFLDAKEGLELVQQRMGVRENETRCLDW